MLRSRAKQGLAGSVTKVRKFFQNPLTGGKWILYKAVIDDDVAGDCDGVASLLRLND
jgi:hypothetical protein